MRRTHHFGAALPRCFPRGWSGKMTSGAARRLRDLRSPALLASWQVIQMPRSPTPKQSAFQTLFWSCFALAPFRSAPAGTQRNLQFGSGSDKRPPMAGTRDFTRTAGFPAQTAEFTPPEGGCPFTYIHSAKAPAPTTSLWLAYSSGDASSCYPSSFYENSGTFSPGRCPYSWATATSYTLPGGTSGAVCCSSCVPSRPVPSPSLHSILSVQRGTTIN